MASGHLDTTQMLRDAVTGNRAAADRLLPLVYRELRELAAGYLRRERPDHTLQPTALAHEAYLKLVDQTRVQWQDRAHFMAIAATAMRRILVNHAKHRRRHKRGGRQVRVTLDEAAAAEAAQSAELVALDEALTRLAAVDPQQSRIVELRFFGGLSVEETAAMLDLSPRTVYREWAMARAWLEGELAEEDR